MLKSVALSTGPITHLDHLGVLSILLGIPLILTSEEALACAKRFYPMAKVQMMEPSELTLEHLAHSYDALYYCGKFWASDLLPAIELLYKKKVRLIFCPHGNSDKEKEMAQQDIALVYGEQMARLYNSPERLVRTGNYRYQFYKEHREFYDALARDAIKSSPDKPTLLYAPTWHHRSSAGSFFEECSHLIQELCEPFNLLVKLHPFLEEDFPAHTYALYNQYEGRATFLSDFPAIYPLLALSDLYLGDLSSITYDYLAFDKPLFFLHEGNPEYAHQCGIVISPSKQVRIGKMIVSKFEECKEQFKERRKESYRYAFGEERSANEIKSEILTLF